MQPFALERFFGLHEQSSKFLLCVSDCETWTVADLCGLSTSGVEDLLGLSLSYGQNEGSPQLRQLISQGLYHNNPQVLLHVGAQEALFNFFNSVLSPPDHVIVVSPSYQSLSECPKARGCCVSDWPLIKSSNGLWSYDLPKLSELISPDTKCIVINTPHNPTGAVLSREEAEAIVALCQKHSLYLLSDEVYFDLQETTPTFTPPLPICDMYEKGISVGVLSKSYGLAGLRLGWMATKDSHVFEVMANYKDYTTISCPIPSEFLGSLAVSNKDKLIKRNLDIVNQNLDLFKQFCSQNTEFKWTPPLGGCLSFVHFDSPMTTTKLTEECLKRKSLLILPSNVFVPTDEHHFRIGFGRKNFSECLEQLSAVMKELKSEGVL